MGSRKLENTHPLPPQFKDQLIDRVKTKHQSLAAVLRSCKELTLEDNTIIMTMNYQFHYDRLNEPKAREVLSDIASGLLEKEIIVKPILVKKEVNNV